MSETKSTIANLIPFFSAFAGAGTAFVLGWWRARRDRRNEEYSAILANQVTVSNHIEHLRRIKASEPFADPGFATGDSMYGHLHAVFDDETVDIKSISFMLRCVDVRSDFILRLKKADASYASFQKNLSDRNDMWKEILSGMEDHEANIGPDGKPGEGFSGTVDPKLETFYKEITAAAVLALDLAIMRNLDAMREFRVEALKLFPKRRFMQYDEYGPSMAFKKKLT